jgi:anti-anti-sigma factor
MMLERSATMNSLRANSAGARLFAKSDVAVVQLPEAAYGSLDAANLTRVRRLLMELAKQPSPPCLVVDLSSVHYLGAGFIGIVISAWDELKKQNRRLVLCGLNEYCARLFHTLHLDRLFRICSSLDAALVEIGANRRTGAPESQTALIRIDVSDIDWDQDLLRLEYRGGDGEPIRCVIVPRQE